MQSAAEPLEQAISASRQTVSFLDARYLGKVPSKPIHLRIKGTGIGIVPREPHADRRGYWLSALWAVSNLWRQPFKTPGILLESEDLFYQDRYWRKSASRTGNRRFPQFPGVGSNSPLISHPQFLQVAFSVRCQPTISYRTRSMSGSAHCRQ